MWLLVAIRAEGRPGFSKGGDRPTERATGGHGPRPAPLLFSAMWPSVRALVHERAGMHGHDEKKDCRKKN